MSDDNTMDSVMIDLETMATGPNAGVIQVGAIPFNSRTGLVKPDLFEVDVDLTAPCCWAARSMPPRSSSGGTRADSNPSARRRRCAPR